MLEPRLAILFQVLDGLTLARHDALSLTRRRAEPRCGRSGGRRSRCRRCGAAAAGGPSAGSWGARPAPASSAVERRPRPLLHCTNRIPHRSKRVLRCNKRLLRCTIAMLHRTIDDVALQQRSERAAEELRHVLHVVLGLAPRLERAGVDRLLERALEVADL